MNPDITREHIRRNGLEAFVREFWEESGESATLVWEPHMSVICRHLEAAMLRASKSLKRDLERATWAEKRSPEWTTAVDGSPKLTLGVPEEIPYLVIAVPPGCSKSMLTSVFAPTWAWTWCPGMRFIGTCYADDLANDFGRRAVQILLSEKFRALWPHIQMPDGDRSAMSDFRNNHGGRRWSMPMGGKVTGKHAHVLFSDDPVKPDELKDAGSEGALAALQEAVYRWDSVFSSRSAHPETFTRIIIAQRLHVNDLSGHAIRQGATHLKLPMEFVPEDRYQGVWGSDWRTEAGELLLPKRFTQDVIAARRKIMPPVQYGAQMQQNPVLDDGNLFQREWFSRRYFGRPWELTNLTLSVDSSNKAKKDSDFFVAQVWARMGDEFFLVDMHRERLEFPGQVQAIKRLLSKYPKISKVLIEQKANGIAITQQLKGAVPASIIEIEPRGSKEARAQAVAWVWSEAKVRLPDGCVWLDGFVNEHLSFPVGGHDDMVDAAVQYLDYASADDRRKLLKAAMANVRKTLGVGASTYRIRY